MIRYVPWMEVRGSFRWYSRQPQPNTRKRLTTILIMAQKRTQALGPGTISQHPAQDVQAHTNRVANPGRMFHSS